MHIAYQKVSVEDARKVLDDKKPATRPDVQTQRLPQQMEPLSQKAEEWLMKLPSHLRPIELPRRFPRIVNKLYELRKRPVHFEHYLVELLIMDRGTTTRQGFPSGVASELAKLHMFSESLFPVHKSEKQLA